MDFKVLGLLVLLTVASFIFGQCEALNKKAANEAAMRRFEAASPEERFLHWFKFKYPWNKQALLNPKPPGSIDVVELVNLLKEYFKNNYVYWNSKQKSTWENFLGQCSNPDYLKNVKVEDLLSGSITELIPKDILLKIITTFDWQPKANSYENTGNPAKNRMGVIADELDLGLPSFNITWKGKGGSKPSGKLTTGKKTVVKTGSKKGGINAKIDLKLPSVNLNWKDKGKKSVIKTVTNGKKGGINVTWKGKGSTKPSGKSTTGKKLVIKTGSGSKKGKINSKFDLDIPSSLNFTLKDIFGDFKSGKGGKKGGFDFDLDFADNLNITWKDLFGDFKSGKGGKKGGFDFDFDFADNLNITWKNIFGDLLNAGKKLGIKGAKGGKKGGFDFDFDFNNLNITLENFGQSAEGILGTLFNWTASGGLGGGTGKFPALDGKISVEIINYFKTVIQNIMINWKKLMASGSFGGGMQMKFPTTFNALLPYLILIFKSVVRVPSSIIRFIRGYVCNVTSRL